MGVSAAATTGEVRRHGLLVAAHLRVSRRRALGHDFLECKVCETRVDARIFSATASKAPCPVSPQAARLTQEASLLLHSARDLEHVAILYEVSVGDAELSVHKEVDFATLGAKDDDVTIDIGELRIGRKEAEVIIAAAEGRKIRKLEATDHRHRRRDTRRDGYKPRSDGGGRAAKTKPRGRHEAGHREQNGQHDE